MDDAVELSKSVLVVVDVQLGFVVDRSRHVVPVIVDLVRRWQAAGGATVFTRYFNYPDSPFERHVGWTAMHGAPETDIVPELAGLASRATAVLDKTVYTALTPEGLDLISKNGWTDLYVCGIATESCVLKTAVDAFEVGLTPWLIEDASSSTAGPAAHDAGILVATRFIGRGQIIQSSQLPIPAATPA